MQFEIRALKGKNLETLEISASKLEDAYLQIKQKGYIPISVIEVNQATSLKKEKKFSLALFSQELLSLLDAGLNLVEAIETLVSKEERSLNRTILDGVLQQLYQGQRFSDAISIYPNAFPLLYVATVRASEKTGDLSVALKRYVHYEMQLNLLKKKVISASIYPALLMIVGGLVITFLLGFVVPKFSAIYAGNGGNLPFLSKVLLAWGNALDAHGKAIGLVGILSILFMIFIVRQPDTKRWIFNQLWQIPSLGHYLKLYQLARFYRTLGMLLNGGTPILVALQSVSGLLDSSLQKNMQQAISLINQGMPVSQAMLSSALTTPVADRMLMVGERGGNIGHMMERIAEFYDEELSRWIEWFTKLFEPILMLLIGLVIGVVVLLLYMPIFELAGSIQ